MGYLDLSNRYAGLDAKSDPLVKLNAVAPWDDSRANLDAVWRRPSQARNSRAGRKPWDTVVMVKAIVPRALYNLSDEQFEHQLRDRLSFMRFLGLGLEDPAPDATTVWLHHEQLVLAGVVEELFAAFDAHLKAQGWLAMGGQMIDASIVPVPKQRNTREENAAIKAGETPEGGEDNPARSRQKDTDARWTKKHGKARYGYKNHVNVDRRHKLMRRYKVTDASIHDSQALDDVLDDDNTASDVWADSAHRSAEIEGKLEERGLKSRIHRKAHRNRPLTEREKQGNRTRSTVRARVEHVFGAQSNDMGARRCAASASHAPERGSASRTSPATCAGDPARRSRRCPRFAVSAMLTGQVRPERSSSTPNRTSTMPRAHDQVRPAVRATLYCVTRARQHNLSRRPFG